MKPDKIVDKLLETPDPDDPHTFLKHFTGPKTITTVWEIYTYDVWGNADDGYEVNDVRKQGTVELELEVQTNNPGTPHAFQSAQITDDQIKEVFGIKKRSSIETDGDDMNYDVTLERSGYPVGKLECVSHDSLSPIRALKSQSSDDPVERP